MIQELLYFSALDITDNGTWIDASKVTGSYDSATAYTSNLIGDRLIEELK